MQSIDLLFPKFYLDVKCITQHEGFDAVCLNKYVLWAALVGLNDRECAWLSPEDNVPNRLIVYFSFQENNKISNQRAHPRPGHLIPPLS